MKPNVGGMDRNARIVAGIVLLAFAALAPVAMGWRVAAVVVAAIALVTATARFCPVNAALGINTHEGDQAAKR